ncbi:hypothetical protein [Paenarthrobacter aurescens]|nr:hypothetical protein [Paenarthrobacter aurescens]
MKGVPGTAASLTLAIAVVMSLLLTSACAVEPKNRPADRMVNLGFEDVVNSDPLYLTGLAERLDSVDATAVSLAVGRTDWTAFPLQGQTETESSEVARTGRDYVAESISALEFAEDGRKRDVVLTIDALLDRALTAEPALAGRDTSGAASSTFASVSSLRHGKAGSRLASLAAVIAGRYRPTAVNLTELMFDDFTFGEEDLIDFKATTGAKDWPRKNDGSIDASDASISGWRSEAMADIVLKVRTAVEPYGVKLDMDVRAPRESPSLDRADSGHDYDLLLKQADRLHVWEYVGLNSESSPQTKELAEAMNRRAGSRISLSVGLWGNDGRISAGELATALRDAVLGGATSVSVTPASLMEGQHWDVLKEAWAT